MCVLNMTIAHRFIKLPHKKTIDNQRMIEDHNFDTFIRHIDKRFLPE